MAPKAKAKGAGKKASSQIDLQAKTRCPICHVVCSNHALLYTHTCKQEALAAKKQLPRLEEPPPPPPLVRQTQPSYKDLLREQHQELQHARAMRMVGPLRAHYGL